MVEILMYFAKFVDALQSVHSYTANKQHIHVSTEKKDKEEDMVVAHFTPHPILFKTLVHV